MNIELAIRMAEILLGFAFLLQSVEYLQGLPPEKFLGAVRAILSLLLLMGFQPLWVETGLLILALILLHRFQGPYNGGSDCMSMLVLLCLWLTHIVPAGFWQEVALGYLAFQLVFSYFQSGYIKIINQDWRSGQALHDVFALTAYPVSVRVQALAQSPRLLQLMSRIVIAFEVLFPITLFNQTLFIIALMLAAVFHLANAVLFGLNRFFWIWLAAYPVVLWFQQRLFT